jgi:hypothetical protein
LDDGAFRLTRKDGSPGIDGVTAGDCEAIMREADLLDLLERVKSGGYRVPPVCRAYFPNVDVIIRRYEAASGKPAILIATGESFEDCGARRATKAALA